VSVPAPDRGLSSRVCPLPPSGAGWLHEIKHDGFRILARKDAAGVKLITPAGNDFSSRFPFIAMAVGKLPVRSCLIDGEAIVATRTALRSLI
jgi:bifunctional non-homologous end joining protein LigD